MTQMLPMVVNHRQNDRDVKLPHVASAYNSASFATRLALNEGHMDRLSRLPFTVLEYPNVGRHQSLNQDQLVHCDLARDRQQQAFNFVRHQHVLTATRIKRRNSALADDLHKTTGKPMR